ncbi:recQ-like DNA helicase BLM [Saccostrea echinata]|uniref:recQ-like DNA helicase BLM n=1 Tax=Saccostrea echinata TaxID=191078 RepID=UPI002A80EAF0|nr:recQ-like DNA helicase BLM [Saccostrea echinata]
MLTDESRKRVNDTFKVKLRENQEKAINAVLLNRDVFVGTRTGSGKSLVYESIPVIKPGIVVIVAPLLSIMREQVEKLNNFGLAATYIGKNVEENEKIEAGQYDFVVGSPERLIGERRWRDMFKSEEYRRRLQLLVVDEAHTQNNFFWGEGRTDEDPFREWFSKIQELRSLCPNVPVLALTATAGPTQRSKILKCLCFRPGYELVLDSPDRRNIKITVKPIKNNDTIDKVFDWLIKDLRHHREQLPRHVVFCNSISDVTKIYFAFIKNCRQNRSNFEMFHSKTDDEIKNKIREDMATEGHIRILICTNAAGMGVNFHQVHNVHYGIPRELETFVQQMGRGGRDGKPSHELVLFKAHKGYLKHVEPELVRIVKDNSVCRRNISCNAFQTKHCELTPLHACCDVCEKKCKCQLDTCPESHVAMKDDEEGGSSEDEMERNVSVEERRLLTQKLESLQFTLSDKSSGGLLNSDSGDL